MWRLIKRARLAEIWPRSGPERPVSGRNEVEGELRGRNETSGGKRKPGGGEDREDKRNIDEREQPQVEGGELSRCN